MTTVTLYIPCYNGEAFIAACIEGALSQTLPPDEILVIDDGSTDRSVELASGYPQVRVVQHETNKGLAVARNTALREARGDLLASLDPDCVAKPTWLQTLVAIMDASPKISGCSGMLVENFIDSGRRPLSRDPPAAALGRAASPLSAVPDGRKHNVSQGLVAGNRRLR